VEGEGLARGMVEISRSRPRVLLLEGVGLRVEGEEVVGGAGDDHKRREKKPGWVLEGGVWSTVSESQLGPGFAGGVAPGNGGREELFFSHAVRVAWSTGQASTPASEDSLDILSAVAKEG
jgi:hypothetical protein